MRLPLLFTLTCSLSFGQGVGADWDIVAIVQALSQNAARLVPLVEQLTPNDWLAKGAPDAYVAQWQTARKELASLSTSTKALEKDPEKLTAALDTYFRFQLIDGQLKSLANGVRQYQNPAVADLLVSALSENSVNRDHLQQHITDLAEQKEKEFQVVDKEAQRCRAQVIRQVPTRTGAVSPAQVKKPAVKQ
jgi:hypothetical protein